MSQTSSIEWTDLTWNPVHGCSIVSTECRNCYAQTLSLRYRQTPKPWTPANAAENVLLKPHKLREPLSESKDWRGLGAAAAAAGKTDGKLVFVNGREWREFPGGPRDPRLTVEAVGQLALGTLDG